MEEIKLRAWDVKRECYFIPKKLDLENRDDGLPWVHDGSKFITDVILEQFIGRYDRNGNEIYKGDKYLISLGEGVESIDTVEWSETRAGFVGRTPAGTIYPIPWGKIEVVGNIHEDQEMVEEQWDGPENQQ
ncbi:MAG: hypothetical protein K9M94_12975 [Spirochaetia bacterium]|nr:hypothetical protein [Spirochaetia bacterium]